MKTKITIFLCLLCSANLLAQRHTNSGHDTAANPYDKILDNTARGKRTARFLKNFLPPDLMRDRFQFAGCNEYVVLADKRIAQFRSFIDKFQSLPSDPKQMKLAEEAYKKNGCKSIHEKVAYELEHMGKHGSYTNDAYSSDETMLCRMKGSVQLLKSNLAYLEAIKKIFPATPGVDETIKLAQNGIAKYGDSQSALASIKNNKAKALGEEVFPKAVGQNGEWEAWFKSWFTQNYHGYSYSKQSLLTANWFVKKHEISGLPEYRQIGTAIGAKAPDGTCWIFKVDIFQEYISGKFGQSRFKLAEKYEILCKKLE